MLRRFLLGVGLVGISVPSLAQDIASGYVPSKITDCPASGFHDPIYGVFGRNAGDGPAPAEVASPCTPQEVIAAAEAVGMARSHFNAPLGIKNIVTIMFSAKGSMVTANGKVGPVEKVDIQTHYGKAAQRIAITRPGGASEIRVVHDGYTWNEVTEGGSAAKSPGSAREREILTKLTPFGGIWSAAEAQGTVKVDRIDGKVFFTSVSPYDKLEVTTYLDASNRPERVIVKDGGNVYEATFSGWRGGWEPDYLVIFPERIVWTRNGKPLADLTISEFKSNPYVVFPVPAAIKAAGVDRSTVPSLPKRVSPFANYASSITTDAPTPRTPDGKPDLSGVWGNVPSPAGPGGIRKAGTFEPDQAVMQRGSGWDKPLYKPEFWEKVRSLDFSKVDVDPAYGCTRAGTPRQNAPSKIVQAGNEIVLYNAGQIDSTRFIPLDGGALTAADMDKSTWLGIGSGHWEGDVLVVESVGFNDTSWLQWQGYFHTDMMKVTERFWRKGDYLYYNWTVYDPDVLMEPWTQGTLVRKLLPAATRLDEAAPCDVSPPDGDPYMRG